MTATEPRALDAVDTAVDLDSLDVSEPLRPLDADHVLTLTDVLDRCPPLLVHRVSGRVVDGHHRIAAARAAERKTLPVRWLDGESADVLERAVAANTRHGLPLSFEQRRDAASRLLELAPEYSNRRIAASCGVSEATVRRLRRPGASGTHPDTVLGVDGKHHPATDAATLAAAQLLSDEPGLSDRAIAARAKVSPSTVGRLRRIHDAEATTTGPRRASRSPGVRWLRWLTRLFRRRVPRQRA